MQPVTLNHLARSVKCAVYNELGPITPYYLTPQRYSPVYFNSEILFHKRNLLLLSLIFDRIIISSDNVLAFTRFLSKDVVSSVVKTSWFTQLVENNIIVMAGWGSSINANMMLNQIDYSSIFRPDLKDNDYVRFLTALSETASWVVREPAYGERDHIKYFMPHLRRLDGVFQPKELQFIEELVRYTQATVGYIGTMELFPFIDELYATNAEKSDAFYRAYYVSWHEYCATEYAPAIPIQTSRLRLPITRVPLITARGQSAIAALYSPDLFQAFLVRRFGQQLVNRLLGIEITQLVKIRNGDWMKFKEKYHECIQAASNLAWIGFHPRASELLQDQQLMDDLIADIFKLIDQKADLSALGGLLDVIMGMLVGVGGVGVIFRVLKEQINKKLGGVANSLMLRDFEPFLKKLRTMLETSSSSFIIAVR